MGVICVGGVGLIAYSRYEATHPATTVTTKKSTIGPTATDNWNAAFAVDICGTIQPDLAPNSLSGVGLRTFGNGLINIDPGAAAKPATYEGAKATLGLFAKDYSGFSLTNTSVEYPGKTKTVWKNGDTCSSSAVGLSGPAELQAKVWSSPNATNATISTTPEDIHLSNGEMITLAFVPLGANIPEPPSKTTLVQSIGSSALSPTKKK
jgi:hypothetical protein